MAILSAGLMAQLLSRVSRSKSTNEDTRRTDFLCSGIGGNLGAKVGEKLGGDRFPDEAHDGARRDAAGGSAQPGGLSKAVLVRGRWPRGGGGTQLLPVGFKCF